MSAFRRLLTLALPAAIMCAASGARATDDAGTQSVFAQGAGSRAVARGGAFVAAGDDASAILWNPAGLGLVTRGEVQAVQSMDLGFGTSESFAAIALPSWRWGTAAFSFRHHGVGGIEQRDDRNMPIEGELESQEFEAALGYGRALGDAWSVGGSVKLQHQALAGFSGSGLGLDLGFTVRPAAALHVEQPWAEALTWGLSARNLIAPSIRLDDESVPDPATLRTGLAWRSNVTGHGLVAEVGFSRAAGTAPRLHAGAEYNLAPSAALRVGTNGGNLTAGAGLQWRQVSFEYAFENTPLARSHRAGVTLGFGASNEEKHAAYERREDEAVERRLAEAFHQRQDEQVAQLLARAEEARARGDLDGALEQIALTHTLAPDLPAAAALESACLHGKADALEHKGDLAEAALVWELAASVAPADTLARAGAVRCRMESDARARRTEERRTRFAHGMDAFAADDLRTARADFAALVRAEPSDSEAVRMLERTEAGVTRRASVLAEQATRALRAGALNEATARLAEAESFDRLAPGVAQAEAALASARRAPEPAHATPARPSAPRLSDHEAEDLFGRALRALKAQRTEEAMRYWEILWASRPGYRDVAGNLKREYLTRGIELFAAGRLDEATAEWERVLRIDPADERARGYLARAETQRARSREIQETRR